MERHELETALETVIQSSGVDLDGVIETLELMLERYSERLEGESS